MSQGERRCPLSHRAADMRLPNGKYRTAAGSTVSIHEGRSDVVFDWFEEGGCVDCSPDPFECEGYLVWRCPSCGGGQSELKPDVGKCPFCKSPGIEDRAAALEFSDLFPSGRAVRCSGKCWIYGVAIDYEKWMNSHEQ